MASLVLAASSVAAAALVGGAGTSARARLRRALRPARQLGRPQAASPSSVALFALLALGGVAGLASAIGRGPALVALGLLVIGAGRGRLAARAARRRDRSAVAAQLPRFADLLAACLAAGATPADALDVVRRRTGGPVAERMAPVAGALRTGHDAVAAYGDHGPDDPVRGLVRALARALDTGAPLAGTAASLADEGRRQRRWAAEVAARRAGVQAVGPLVGCFLPAFVLLGVVPVVLALVGAVLRSGR